MTKALQDVQKAAISSTLPNQHGPAAKIFRPSAESFASTAGGERGIVEELKEEGDEVLRALREEQKEVIDSLDLKQ
jgi:N-acetyltransferase 10